MTACPSLFFCLHFRHTQSYIARVSYSLRDTPTVSHTAGGGRRYVREDVAQRE